MLVSTFSTLNPGRTCRPRHSPGVYLPWDPQTEMEPYWDPARPVNNRRDNAEARRRIKFVCPKPGCDRTFCWKGSLTWHLRYSCGQQPRFKCPYCSYRCKVKGDIRKHIGRIHKNKRVQVVDLFKDRALGSASIRHSM